MQEQGNINGNKRIAKNTIFLTIRMLIVLIISLYTSRVFLAVLGVEDFGIYNVVCGFVAMFAFLNGAMTTGIQRFYNVELANNGIEGSNRVYITSVFSQFALATIIVLFTETVGLWYIHNKMVIPIGRFDAALRIFQFAVLSLVINIMAVPYSSAVMAHEKMDYYALVSIVDIFLKLGVAIALPYVSSDKLVAYGFLFLLITFIDFLLYYMYAKVKFEEIRFRFIFYRGLFKEIISFSGWNVFGKFSIMLKEQGLNMILNLFFGPVVNAARGIAVQVNGALSGFVSTVNVAVKPQLTQAYAQGNKNRTFSLMFSISKLGYMILLLMAVPICVEIDFVLRIWLGSNVPQYANIFIVLVIATTFINNLNTPVSYVVHATGKMKTYQIATSSVELAVLPIAYWILSLGTPPWIVFIVAFFFVAVGQVVSLFVLRRIEPFSIKAYCKNIYPLLIITIVSVIIACCVSRFLQQGFVRFFVVLLSSTVVICVLSYFFVLSQSEKEIIYKMLPFFKKK